MNDTLLRQVVSKAFPPLRPGTNSTRRHFQRGMGLYDAENKGRYGKKIPFRNYLENLPFFGLWIRHI